MLVAGGSAGIPTVFRSFRRSEASGTELHDMRRNASTKIAHTDGDTFLIFSQDYTGFAGTRMAENFGQRFLNDSEHGGLHFRWQARKFLWIHIKNGLDSATMQADWRPN